jgi:hypothetical protein
MAGCGREASKPAASTEPRPSVALSVLVVNEPELAKAIGLLQGEWAERGGGELHVSEHRWPELAMRQSLDADLIVFPSRYMGELCVRGWLRPLRESLRRSKSFDAADFYPAVERGLVRWGAQVMAAPLGAKFPAALGRDHPGLLMLEAAAPAAVSDDRLGVLFDAETMAPRISDPPFVEALAHLSKRKAGADNGAGDDLAQSRIPVLGFGDRLIAATANSRNAASAFKLLEWLASADVSAQLAATDASLTPVRPSLAASVKWYGSSATVGERQERAAAANDLLNQPREFVLPRIPGIDEYMAALDIAVNSVIEEDKSPQEALAKASARWQEITETRGTDAQRTAYLKHLGIDE